jgi:hypothetical protein
LTFELSYQASRLRATIKTRQAANRAALQSFAVWPDLSLTAIQPSRYQPLIHVLPAAHPRHSPGPTYRAKLTTKHRTYKTTGARQVRIWNASDGWK